MKQESQTIPESLIYEMVNGKPVYLNGYKKYLQGKKAVEEIRGSSFLQSLIIGKLLTLIAIYFGDKYLLLTNELGLLFGKKNWRSADIAIIEKQKVKDKILKLESKYLDVPPKIVIEIDTKADLSEIKDTFGYYYEKTNELLDFGVEKVIWIYTDLQSVLIAEKEQPWQIIKWTESFVVLENLKLNIADILKELSD